MSIQYKKDIYASLLADNNKKVFKLSENLTGLSALRVLLFFGAGFLAYKAITGAGYFFTIVAIILFVTFLIVLRIYDLVEKKLAFHRSLAKVNRNEIDFLDGKASPYDKGKEYADPHHPYSYDLDIFGEGGLFPYLNRASTVFGKKALSQSLLHPESGDIRFRQEAISELAGKLEFRQHFQAYGMIEETGEKEMQQLRSWIETPLNSRNKIAYFACWLFPVAVWSVLITYLITEKDSILGLFFTLFLLNLVVLGLFSPAIKKHLAMSAAVNKVLQQFSRQLYLLETEQFQSSFLLKLQQRTKTGSIPASKSIRKLSSLFNNLDTIINFVVSPLLNGFFLFHAHILFAIEKWKKQNSHSILDWFAIMGETEGLSSFANFSYNNPDFTIPELETTEVLTASEMGHPLIAANKRINNSISFEQERFVILTGSNMSGKSTFLRTLGINLVLARSGSAVCAKQFVFYPYDIEVSMRISDSLQDSESFFYAELKRLQHIIQLLEQGKKLFVILDEILRGTNSNDKHNGTVGLIRKLAGARACGIIATHDLTVSKLAEEYSGYIGNKCFESRIVNDELLFDYKLGDGVCTTLSASFLMKKMGVIEG